MKNMKNIGKRGLSLLLVLVMCFSLLGTSAFAADEPVDADVETGETVEIAPVEKTEVEETKDDEPKDDEPKVDETEDDEIKVETPVIVEAPVKAPVKAPADVETKADALPDEVLELRDLMDKLDAFDLDTLDEDNIDEFQAMGDRLSELSEIVFDEYDYDGMMDDMLRFQALANKVTGGMMMMARNYTAVMIACVVDANNRVIDYDMLPSKNFSGTTKETTNSSTWQWSASGNRYNVTRTADTNVNTDVYLKHPSYLWNTDGYTYKGFVNASTSTPYGTVSINSNVAKWTDSFYYERSNTWGKCSVHVANATGAYTWYVFQANPKTFTLKYDANGGSGAPAQQTASGTGSSYNFTVSSTKPTRTGYDFLGWSTSSTATSASYQGNGSISVSGTTTLYAVWKAVATNYTYKLTWDYGGGTINGKASDTSTETTQKSTHTFYEDANGYPTRTGYNFLDWTYSGNGSFNVNNGQITMNGVANSTVSGTLTANWQRITTPTTVTITVTWLDEDGTMIKQQDYPKGSDDYKEEYPGEPTETGHWDTPVTDPTTGNITIQWVEPGAPTGTEWTVNWMKGYAVRDYSDGSIFGTDIPDTVPVKTEKLWAGGGVVPTVPSADYPADTDMKALRNDSTFDGWGSAKVDEDNHVITITAKWLTKKSTSINFYKSFKLSGTNTSLFDLVSEDFTMNVKVSDPVTGEVFGEEDAELKRDSHGNWQYNCYISFTYIAERGYQVDMVETNYEIDGYTFESEAVRKKVEGVMATPVYDDTGSSSSSFAGTCTFINEYTKDDVAAPELTGITKTLVGTAPTDVKVGDQVTLTYKITVTGEKGANYSVSDPGATLVEGYWDGTIGESGMAEITVTKTVTAAEAGTLTVTNTAYVKPGAGTDPVDPTDPEEGHPSEEVKTDIPVSPDDDDDDDKTITVTWYDENGIDILDGPKTFKKGGTEPTTDVTPTKDADDTYTYEFKEWVKMDDSTEENIKYKATYEPKAKTPVDPDPETVTVTWKNGYNDTPVKVKNDHEKGAEVPQGDYPANPTRTGYTFTGWGTPVTDANGDITITAQWRLNTTPPTGGGGGGGGNIPDDDIEIDDEDVPLAGDLELNRVDHFAYVFGYTDGTVRPLSNISREEVAVIFYRLLTDTARAIFNSESNDFSDVADTRWSNREISTLANAGIITGYADGTFRPSQSITRAEFAAIAARFEDVTDGLESPFSDTKGHWAENQIAYSANRGWVTGYADGTFRPNQAITRAESMTLINNVLARHVDEEGIHADAKQWPDNASDSWYYFAVLEATNSHDYERRTEDGTVENWTEVTDKTNIN